MIKVHTKKALREALSAGAAAFDTEGDEWRLKDGNLEMLINEVRGWMKSGDESDVSCGPWEVVFSQGVEPEEYEADSFDHAPVARQPNLLVATQTERKAAPMFRGAVAYFPDAMAGVARLSRIGNEQHNAGQPMHWAYDKSTDHGDCILRHQADFDEIDTDGVPHCDKVAWRALAQSQTWHEKNDPKLHAYRQAQRDRAAKGER